ncbi:MAG: YczE/YyaS/YitT family protein [Acidimicrobiia bacterium]
MTFALPRTTLPLFARYLAGIVVVSAGATLGIQSAVGAAPYDALLVTLTDRFGVPFWLTAWILQAVWITLILRAGGRFSIATLLHSLSFGPIMAVMLAIIPEAESLLASSFYLAASVVGMAVGIWLYLGSGFIAGMVDTLFETVSERGRWRPTGIRTTFDVACCAVAWIGTGPVGVGTVVLAFGVGPLLGVIDSGLLRPASWRGIPLGRARGTVAPAPMDLVDTTEYRLFGAGMTDL